jgi:predicted branched-subunit amino acid permease
MLSEISQAQEDNAWFYLHVEKGSWTHWLFSRSGGGLGRMKKY